MLQLTRLRDVPACFWRALVLAIVLGVVLAAALHSGRAAAQDLDDAVLVVATPDLKGPYAGAVMLGVPFRGGHVGVMLNRPGKALMGEAFPDHPPSLLVRDPMRSTGSSRSTRTMRASTSARSSGSRASWPRRSARDGWW
jgi:hypothetical protein